MAFDRLGKAIAHRRFPLLLARTIMIGGPWIIAWLFQSYPRLLVPASCMAVIVFAAAIFAQQFFAILSAISAAVALWYFDVPPRQSWGFVDYVDSQALAAFAAILTVGVVILTRLGAALRAAQDHLQEVETFEQVQRALLPSPTYVETSAGISFSTQYRTSQGLAVVGGDWYTVLPVSNGYGMCIGDIAGSGFDALAAMAEARFGFRALAAHAASPSDAIALLEACLRQHHLIEHDYGTMLYAVLDTTTGRCSYANAGHLPPIVRRHDGTTQWLDHPPARMLLPTFPPVVRPNHQVDLTPGDIILFVTDGVVEQRDTVITDELTRLCAHIAELGSDDLETITNAIMPSHPCDDAAALAVRYQA